MERRGCVEQCLVHSRPKLLLVHYTSTPSMHRAYHTFSLLHFRFLHNIFGAELIVGIGLAASLIELIRTGRATILSLQALGAGRNTLSNDNVIQLRSLLQVLETVERRIKTISPPQTARVVAWMEWNHSLLQEVEGYHKHVRQLKSLADALVTIPRDEIFTKFKKTTKHLFRHRETLGCYKCIGRYKTSICSLMTAALWDQQSLSLFPVPSHGSTVRNSVDSSH